jgi:C-terminal processing protease CtpA/Prc
MRLVLLFLSTTILTGSCVSIKKYNSNLNDLRSERNLKSDVDYAYRKLQKLHPDLYWYISKKELDLKFDSLKSTITAPMTSNDFYLKLSPVIASVRQGHMRLIPLTKKLNRKERIAQMKTGTTPFSQFDFERFDDNLYIVKNYSSDSSIKAGTEVVAVNNIKPQELISKYSKTFASDGFNQTFTDRKSGKAFPAFYYYQNDITDSVLCQLKFNDTIRTVWLKRSTKSVSLNNNKPVKKSDLELKKEKEEKKKENTKRHLLGYDRLTKSYSKSLSFFEPDSSIAVMKINDFSKGSYKKFYSNSFSQMDSLRTKYLILDLRDNPGGRIKEIFNLYSYLADTNFYFLDKSEVVSKTSLLHNNFFMRNPVSMFLFLPVEIVYTTIILLKVKKDANNKYYYTYSGTVSGHPKPDNFKGKVYVLINGGSFSASCILSSNLKGSERAFFVGEETGGAYNGTVAGLMPLVRLPKSKLNIRLGLACVQPHYKSDIEGRGIFPDFQIKPTLEDRIKGNDPELSWVLDDIRGRHATIGLVK